MKEKGVSFKRVFIINTLAIIVATAIAIFLHAIVPGADDLNVADFDSMLVKLFGFPVVAVFLFYNSIFTLCACHAIFWKTVKYDK
ncbi:MAG: hypothetical protein LRY73_19015 [Bacillus sp. (in: Bacteria)]|nr:hypothetical protein [Bacillus sp. (in: firmicutes)]